MNWPVRSLIPALMACLLSWAICPAKAEAFWDFGSKKKKAKSIHKVAMIRVAGAYPDKPSSSGLFSSTKSFQRFQRRLRTAAKSKDVKAVVFRLGGLAVGLAKAEAMHNAILALRKAGKKTYAMLEVGASADYLVAMACDKVLMPVSGMLLLPGLRSEALYFKKMMDRFGLAADFVTVGDFKTAPEPYLRESMSKAQRLQVTQLIDGLYGHMVSLIARQRKLPAAKVKALIDRGLLSAEDAQKAGLVNQVIYNQDLFQQLRKQLGKKAVKFVARYAIKKRRRPTSLWSMFSMLLNPKKRKYKQGKPKIAVVYTDGTIYYGRTAGGLFSTESDIWSDSLIKTLEKVRKLKNLRAVILRVNSPGGSALASDLIWRKLEQLKKKAPLFVSMGNVAASGGYYISMGADVIVAQPTTITGSIGIFAGKVILRGAMEKLGISIQSVSRGKNSGMFSAFERFSDSERASLSRMLKVAYNDFVTKAAKGRKMKKEALLKVAGGRVWTGIQAKKVGLVDQLGDLETTIGIAMKRTGLSKRPQILAYPRPKGFFEALQELSSRNTSSAPYAMRQILAALSVLPGSLSAPLRFLLQSHKQKQRVMMYQPLPRFRLR